MQDVIKLLLGFFFALILFYVKERWKDENKKKELAKLLRRELEYNILLIDQWIKDIRQDLYFLTWARPIFIFSPRYDLFQKYFINKALESGLIYDLLNNEQINTIANILSFFSAERERRLLEFIKRYKVIEMVDDEGTPGKNYIEMELEDELKIIQDMRTQVETIIPLIKYENTQLMYKLVRVWRDIMSKCKIN
jgi:hypothetical protein